jgi:hypothetical protein
MVRTEGVGWHIPVPSVYLDQWVWIRFARVVRGVSNQPGDAAVLQAVMAASTRGVAFPLSATHYKETLRIADPRQRDDLASVMASVSHMRTLRRQTDLVRHQLLVAMHEMVGRPTFRPRPLEVLGLGASWAFRGIRGQLRVLGPDGTVQDVDAGWIRHATQHLEKRTLAGPGDNDIGALRRGGYVSPRELEERPGNRVAWEEEYARMLQSESPSRAELRVWLLARELQHEYVDPLTSLLQEYRLTFADIAGKSGEESTRHRAVAFAERVPTLRISADMKLEMFRNPSRPWTINMVRDIDAVSVALPYCRAVVADRDAVALLRRSDAPARHGSVILHNLAELPEVLDDLAVEAARQRDVDHTGWNVVGPGSGFRCDQPPPLDRTGLPPGAVVRLCGPMGPLSAP